MEANSNIRICESITVWISTMEVVGAMRCVPGVNAGGGLGLGIRTRLQFMICHS